MQYQIDRVRFEVNLDAIEHNYMEIKRRIGSNCELMAVVKGNAYGLGAIRIAQELEGLGCSSFGVAYIEEAMELRENGVTSPILMLGPLNPIYTELAIDNDIEVPLVSFHQAEALSKKARQYGKRIKGHIKLDTGLSRLGIVVNNRLSETLSEIKKIVALKGIDVVGLFTHFTASDLIGSEEFNLAQMSLFAEIASECDAENILLKKHCSSSMPLERYPQYNYDCVRVGALLLGLCSAYSDMLDIKQSVTLRTRICQVKQIEANTPVSYGPIFHTLRKTRIAVIPMGFADGLRRTISNRGYMLIHGKKAPIIGKLSANYSTLDITDIPGAKEGEIVTVFGFDNGLYQTINEYANLYPGTVAEVTSTISQSIPRIYTRESRIIDQIKGIQYLG